MGCACGGTLMSTTQLALKVELTPNCCVMLAKWGYKKEARAASVMLFIIALNAFFLFKQAQEKVFI